MSTPKHALLAPDIESLELEELKQRRKELRRKHPEIAESDRLDVQIETIEREAQIAARRYDDLNRTSTLEKVVSNGAVKLFARPKIRAYFRGEQLFRSRGDNEYAATSSISLFTDLLFIGVLAETGSIAVINGSALNLGRFIIYFLPSWRIWCFIRDLVATYEMNAASQRFMILFILWLLVGFTVK